MLNEDKSRPTCERCACELREPGHYTLRCLDTGCECHSAGGVNELTFETVEL